MRLTSDTVSTAAQLACLLEVSADKPGNVSPTRHFRDARYEHFLASAAAIGPALMRAGERPVGPTILAATEATARWSPSNTNFGIILLFAPLARAALVGVADTFRESVVDVLAGTTVADARAVYAAIRHARPGGLGHVDAQDVSEEPTATLRDVMVLAAERDSIAREYATAFATTFDIGVPALVRARRDQLPWHDATVETYLTLLADRPDTLIARKRGINAAGEVSRRATAVLAIGGVRTGAGRAELEALDVALRDPSNTMNPGTTADLTAAAIFVALLGEDAEGRRTCPGARLLPPF